MSQPRRPRGVSADWLAFAAVCVFALLLRAPIADIPLERDEGEYAYIAQRWLHGEIPYRDSFNQKWPGTFAIYAIILRTAGTSPGAIHWATQVYTLGTLAAVFLIGRRFSSTAGGLASGVFAALLLSGRSLLGNAANTEVFMALPLAAAMLALTYAIERDSARWACAVGAWSAAAMLFKQVAVFNLVFCALALLWSTRRRLAGAAGFGLGAAAVGLPVVAYFVAHGAGHEMYDATIGYNLHYQQRLAWTEYPRYFLNGAPPIFFEFWPVVLLAALPPAAALRGWWRRAPVPPLWRRPALVAFWAVASFGGTASPGYFREHYFIQCVPAVAVLGGIAIAHAQLPGTRAALSALLRAALVIVPVAVAIARSPWYYLPGAPAQKSRGLYGTNPFVESPMVARFIAERSGEDDTVFVFGSEPQILYYAERRSASRYIFLYPLAADASEATRARQLAVLDELTRARPRFIVTVGASTTFIAAVDAPTDLPDRLTELVEEAYQLAAAVPDTDESAPPLLTGERAAALWRDHPVTCCSLAVWERHTADDDA